MLNRVCFFAIFLLAFSTVAESAGENVEAMPSGGWQETGQLPLSYAAARNRLASRFENQGFQLVHEIDLGRCGERRLMLWEKLGKKVMVMLWRIDVDKSGYSIGEVKEGTSNGG